VECCSHSAFAWETSALTVRAIRGSRSERPGISGEGIKRLVRWIQAIDVNPRQIAGKTGIRTCFAWNPQLIRLFTHENKEKSQSVLRIEALPLIPGHLLREPQLVKPWLVEHKIHRLSMS
jgi:hypothetical protein